MDTDYHWDLNETQSTKKEFCNTNKKISVTNSYSENVGWDVTQGFFPTPRHRLYTELHKLLKHLENADRDTILGNLSRWADVPETGRPGYRALSQEEVRLLNHGRIMDIGSHTVTHSLLKQNARVIQENEIFNSKKYLENVINHEITSFSYPFGGYGDFSKDTEMIVRNAGYQLACANYCDPVTKGTNPFALPRYLVRNWNKDQFAHIMSKWFNG
jgi:peptidoglycan/xylan/chitin deacetylase (PgdA/CDA1 family)